MDSRRLRLIRPGEGRGLSWTSMEQIRLWFTATMFKFQNLLDDAKCYETVLNCAGQGRALPALWRSGNYQARRIPPNRHDESTNANAVNVTLAIWWVQCWRGIISHCGFGYCGCSSWAQYLSVSKIAWFSYYWVALSDWFHIPENSLKCLGSTVFDKLIGVESSWDWTCPTCRLP